MRELPMIRTGSEEIRVQLGTLKLEAHAARKAAGAAAARAAADELLRLAKTRDQIGVIFATGASQLETLEALTSMPGLPWDRVVGFHMDEYVGLDENHPASFRKYMREKLVSRAPMRRFYEIDGNAADPESFCRSYAQELERAAPALCLLGIGENGHLAFNDPGEADFNDPLAIKVVTLDAMCRQQQVAEGWFPSPAEVPRQAITLTIPTLLNVPKLIASVPGSRKAAIVRRTLAEPISAECPSTILRAHPDATIYLDRESAAEIDDFLGNTSAPND
jgi:glucosamine-6-phosphate deaminase